MYGLFFHFSAPFFSRRKIEHIKLSIPHVKTIVKCQCYSLDFYHKPMTHSILTSQ